MHRLKAISGFIAAAAVVVIVVFAVMSASTDKNATSSAATPSPTGSTSGYGTPASTTGAHRAGTVVQARPSSLGRLLTDGRGRTLYLFEADKPNVSKLSGAGLSIWPPFAATGRLQAKSGALAAKIGTITGADGKPQVTYDRHPLYYYVGDAKPGQTSGQALNQFGAEWYVLAPSGNKIDNG
jgi:predicted lipoprotein with Yx(FWY)xxD motif